MKIDKCIPGKVYQELSDNPHKEYTKAIDCMFKLNEKKEAEFCVYVNFRPYLQSTFWTYAVKECENVPGKDAVLFKRNK